MNQYPFGGLWGYREVCEFLKCSKSTAIRLWKDKKLIPPPMDLEGVGARWKAEDILSYVLSQAGKTKPAKPKTGDH